MSSEKKLNKHSQKIYHVMSEKSPDLLNNIIFPNSSEGDHYFEIKKHSLNDSETEGLFLNTEDNMITIGFNSYHFHTHFSCTTDYDHTVCGLVKTVMNIISDELLLAKLYMKDSYTGSFLIKKDFFSDNYIKNHMKITGKIKSDNFFFNKCDKVDIISWSGNQDLSFKMLK